MSIIQENKISVRKFILCSRFLTTFKKVRDCEFMHEHQGTNAAIQVSV